MTTSDNTALTYEHVRRPIYPLDPLGDVPFEAGEDEAIDLAPRF